MYVKNCSVYVYIYVCMYVCTYVCKKNSRSLSLSSSLFSPSLSLSFFPLPLSLPPSLSCARIKDLFDALHVALCCLVCSSLMPYM